MTVSEESMPAHEAGMAWPSHYRKIPRVRFESIDQAVELLKSLATKGEPVILEGSNLIDVEKWADVEAYLGGLLEDRKVLVKRSPQHDFRYFDLKKNIGNFEFKNPVEELDMSFEEFQAESVRLMGNDSTERLYLQETLSGHDEMAQEFVSWRWDFLIKACTSCAWGLPDSNELFVGMQDATTPLHFDERENLFFQVAGKKQVVLFPFTDYIRLYPFPTTHPCDRQSMVGNPLKADLTAFPRFAEATGFVAELAPNDLLYLPYGWWHWLRNLEPYTASVSFWSTTPATDLAGGVPSTFSDHMLTRVRRNLESMIASRHGPLELNANMLRLRSAIQNGRSDDPLFQEASGLLAAINMDPEKRSKFLLEIVDGRFDIDWQQHV